MGDVRHYHTDLLWQRIAERGYTLSAFARAIGYHRVYIQYIKNGKKPISHKFAVRAAALLDEPLEALFTPRNDTSPHTR